MLDPAKNHLIGLSVPQRTPKNGFFVAGSDTGVGKTVVAVGLVRLLRRRGIRCVAVKPVETGCPVKSGALFPEDGALLVKAAERDLTLDECVPFRFSVPASPARAAAMQGSHLHVSDLVEHVLTIAQRNALVVVEGAGGLMVPLEENLMVIDLIDLLQYPVILVGRTGLGTINHTLLSVEALRQRNIDLVCIVLSCTDARPGPEEDFTPLDVARLVCDVPVFVLPRLSPESRADPDQIATIMAESWPEWFFQQWIARTRV
jgi:dethiobiotin synthetase